MSYEKSVFFLLSMFVMGMSLESRATTPLSQDDVLKEIIKELKKHDESIQKLGKRIELTEKKREISEEEVVQKQKEVLLKFKEFNTFWKDFGSAMVTVASIASVTAIFGMAISS